MLDADGRIPLRRVPHVGLEHRGNPPLQDAVGTEACLVESQGPPLQGQPAAQVRAQLGRGRLRLLAQRPRGGTGPP
eukprot:7095064-Lingulodinium_polyedra.AAC.1